MQLQEVDRLAPQIAETALGALADPAHGENVAQPRVGARGPFPIQRRDLGRNAHIVEDARIA